MRSNAWLLDEIYDHVHRDALRFKVTDSFVVAVILADHYQIEDQEKI